MDDKAIEILKKQIYARSIYEKDIRILEILSTDKTSYQIITPKLSLTIQNEKKEMDELISFEEYSKIADECHLMDWTYTVMCDLLENEPEQCIYRNHEYGFCFGVKENDNLIISAFFINEEHRKKSIATNSILKLLENHKIKMIVNEENTSMLNLVEKLRETQNISIRKTRQMTVFNKKINLEDECGIEISMEDIPI